MANRSYLLESDQYAAPFQQQANQAEQQAYAQAPQLAIQAYLQLQEHQRRSRESAAHVAVEQGKLQELQIRNQAYVQELQTRRLRAETQMIEAQAQEAMALNKQVMSPFTVRGGIKMGEAYEFEPGVWKKWLPRGNSVELMDATEEDRKWAQDQRKAELAKGRSARSNETLLDPDTLARLGSEEWRQSRLTGPAKELFAKIEKDHPQGHEALARVMSDVIQELRPADADKADFIARYLDAIATDNDFKRREKFFDELKEADFKGRLRATK